MNIRSTLATSIIMELLMLPLIIFPVVLIIFIINGITIIYMIYKLFSKNKNKVDLEQKLNQKDYEEISNIVNLSNIDKQVEKYFYYKNTQSNFLNTLLDNFTEEHRKEFIEEIVSYCRKQLSNTQINFEERNYTIIILSLATRYKK